MLNSAKSYRNGAFTLVELLVVLTVIAILAATLFPVFARAREKARQAACTSNLCQIGIAMTMYAADHNGLLPPYDTDRTQAQAGGAFVGPLRPAQFPELSAALAPYSHTTAFWLCPDDSPPDVTQEGRTLHHDTSYDYRGRMNADRGYLALDLSWHGYESSELGLVNELCSPNGSGPWGNYSHSGRSNVLFHDGHVIAWPIHSSTYDYPNPW